MDKIAIEIYGALRSAILTGQIHPGDLILEGQVAKRYNVSKTPVREALQRLAYNELVEIMPGRGYRVHSPGLREVRELMEVRELLETETAARAAANATSDEIQEMGRLAAVGYVKGDKASTLAFHDANYQFHVVIAQASRNHYLTHLVRQTLDRIQLIVIGEAEFGDPDEIVEEHKMLYEAIAGRDVQEAKRLMALQIRDGLRRFTGLVQGGGGSDYGI